MSLTRILHKTIKESRLGVKQIAFQLDKPYYTFMSELSAQERHKLGAELVLPIMQLTEDYSGMHYMARELGGAFIQYPKTDNYESQMHISLISSIKEFSEFAAIVAEDIKDGIVTSKEYERISREGQEAISAITLLIDLAKQTYTRQYGSLNRKNALAATKTFQKQD